MSENAAELIYHRRASAEVSPAGALLLLHGRGADELDLVSLGDELDPHRRMVVITPRAPLQIPPGGFHWYYVGQVGFPEPTTFWQSFGLLQDFAERLPALTGVPWERTVVGGFSQGAVMSYALTLAPRRPPPAALVAFSGFIPTVEGFTPTADGHTLMSVAAGHGTVDPVINVKFGRAAQAWLTEHGFELRYRESPIGHAIDREFALEIADWLGELIGGESQ